MFPRAQHTRPLQHDVVLRCVRQERRRDRDLSRYKRLPPCADNHKARGRLLGSSRHLQARREHRAAPHWEGEGQPGAERSHPGDGPVALPGRRRLHWSCARGWRRAGRSEAAAPGPAELRQTTEVMCCESVLVSSASDPIQPVLLPPARLPVGRDATPQVPGTPPPAPRGPQPSKLLPLRLSKRLSAGLVCTSA